MQQAYRQSAVIVVAVVTGILSVTPLLILPVQQIEYLVIISLVIVVFLYFVFVLSLYQLCCNYFANTIVYIHSNLTTFPEFPRIKTRLQFFYAAVKYSMQIQLSLIIPKQEAPLSPSDRAMRLVSSNLANYHATVQKLLIRQVLTKSAGMKLEVQLEAMCLKQTDDGRVVHITCIPTTCCGEIF